MDSQNVTITKYSDGSKEWWVDGKLHHKEKPTVEQPNDTEKLHMTFFRGDGPITEYPRDKEWYNNAKFVLEDGPMPTTYTVTHVMGDRKTFSSNDLKSLMSTLRSWYPDLVSALVIWHPDAPKLVSQALDELEKALLTNADTRELAMFLGIQIDRT